MYLTIYVIPINPRKENNFMLKIPLNYDKLNLMYMNTCSQQIIKARILGNPTPLPRLYKYDGSSHYRASGLEAGQWHQPFVAIFQAAIYLYEMAYFYRFKTGFQIEIGQ